MQIYIFFTNIDRDILASMNKRIKEHFGRDFMKAGVFQIYANIILHFTANRAAGRQNLEW